MKHTRPLALDPRPLDASVNNAHTGSNRQLAADEEEEDKKVHGWKRAAGEDGRLPWRIPISIQISEFQWRPQTYGTHPRVSTLNQALGWGHYAGRQRRLMRASLEHSLDEAISIGCSSSHLYPSYKKQVSAQCGTTRLLNSDGWRLLSDALQANLIGLSNIC
ncbi:chemical-damaging agent resistance protein C [Anopheles sinensis]|uniref:Chemical-damaging agent resistance protein C n=1 Tax=Anopheles sinensis TaxID=74873 RepID=A0A084WPG2_ANOSI|nr:chemical-damaging agent resistance protein C [Anopheles sinensis]